MHRSSVVLLPPLEPIIEVTFPGSTWRSAFLSTISLPDNFEFFGNRASFQAGAPMACSVGIGASHAAKFASLVGRILADLAPRE